MEENRIEPGNAEALSKEIDELRRQLVEEKQTSEYWSDKFYKLSKRFRTLKETISNIIEISE
jgi:uncharacterized coiled-coil DUF342 family protein